jgi:hypothetical protein
LTITTSVRTLPTPQPASDATASIAVTARMRNRCKPSSSDPQYTFRVVVTELAEASVAYQVPARLYCLEPLEN